MIYNFKTKDNKPISFTITDEENKTAKPWVFTKIRAFIYNEYVGYLVIGNITPESFHKYIPTIWHYTFLISGYCFKFDKTYFKNLPDKENKFSNQQKIDLVKSCNSYWNFTFGNSEAEINKNINLNTVKIFWPKATKIIKKLKEKQYNYLKLAINKPYIDFIKVNMGETNFDFHDGMKHLTTHTDWRRKRIAIALYVFAAEYLHKKGLKLYASSLQSDDAKEAWKKLEELGLTDFDGLKRFLKIY